MNNWTFKTKGDSQTQTQVCTYQPPITENKGLKWAVLYVSAHTSVPFLWRTMTDMDRTVTGPISHLQILPLDKSFCDVILSLTKHTNATKIRNLQRCLVPQRKIQQNYSLTIKTQGTLFPLASSTVYAKKSNCWIPQLFVQLVLSVLAGNSSGGEGEKGFLSSVPWTYFTWNAGSRNGDAVTVSPSCRK